MSILLFANIATTTLAGAITSTATTANLAAGSGGLFPQPGSNHYYTMTFVDAATGLLNEVVYVTAMSGDQITAMTRGQEGTAPRAWNAGDLASNYWTAGNAAAMIQVGQLQQQTTNYAIDTGAANAITVALTPAPGTLAAMNGAPVRIKVHATNTGATTIALNGFTAAALNTTSGVALIAGQVVVGSIIEVVYDTTAGHFWLETPTPVSTVGGVLTGTLPNPGFAANPSFSGTISGTTIAIGSGSSSIGGTLSITGTLTGTTISASNELYATNVIATSGSGYINVGTGTSTFGGQVNFGANIAAVSGVFSGVVSATGGGTLGGVTLSSSAITAGNGANFGSGTITCGNINAGGGTINAGNINANGGTLTAVDVTATNQVYAEGPLVALGAATFQGGATIYGTLNLFSAGVGEGGWECQVPSGGSTVALESNVGIVGGPTTYTTGTGYLYGGSGPISGNNETGSFGLITTIGAVASGFHTTSDARLKDDLAVVSSEDGLRFIKKVNPYTWNWNDRPVTEKKRASGYVSQQLIVAGFPELVTSFPVKEMPAATHIFNGEEIVSSADFKLIAKYDDTIAYLHAALRGALDLIEKQGQRLAALESLKTETAP
jgi:hypothetical protein